MLTSRISRRKNEIQNELSQELIRKFPSIQGTSGGINVSQNSAEEQFKRDFLQDHLDAEILENEREAFATHKFCNLPQVNISQVNWEKLNLELEKDRFNPQLMEAMACLTATAVITPGNNGPEYLPEHIRTWIKNLRVLSAGSYGETFTAKLGNGPSQLPPNLVIKTPIDDDPSSLAALFHEMIVGFILNKARAKTSGVAYVYGGFTASLPIVGGEPLRPKDVLTYANFDAPIQYLLYEKIAPSIPCGDFFDKPFNSRITDFSFDRGCSLKDFVNILVQISTIHQILFEDFDFTHYDFHPNNVLLLNLGEMVSLPIHMSDGSIFYLETWYLVVIIDLGFAHVRVDGKNYGFSYREVDVYPDRSFPAYDFFKFLLWAGFWSGDTNPEIIEWIDRLSGFFDSQGKISELHDRMNGETFFLPYDSEARLLTGADFYLYLEKEFGEVIDTLYTEEARYRVFDCTSGDCATSNQILKDLHALSLNAPTNPYAFYDYTSTLERSGKTALARKIKVRFNYAAGVQSLANDIHQIHRNLVSLRSIDLRLPTVSLLNNPAVFADYLAQIDKIGLMIEQLQEYRSAARVWNYLFQIQEPYIGRTRLRKLSYNHYQRTLDYLREKLAQLRQISEAISPLKVKRETIASERKRALIRRLTRYLYLEDHWSSFLKTLGLTL